jgi:3-dehydroquinate synthase
MAEVAIDLPHHRYRAVIEAGALARLGEELQAVAPAARCALLTDANVASVQKPVAAKSLRAAGYEVVEATVPFGEEKKSLGTVSQLYEVLLDAHLERRSPVIALGGGVTGDTAGFVASTYLRGVPFVQCPTTLLAMVDSSVGGKVGVNVAQGKNLIGAFYQPVLVVADPTVLETLPDRELRCGLAECIKHGVIRDETLFRFIEERLDAVQSLDAETVVELVRRNVEIKAAVVMEDEKEAGVRAHLNLGHTFAHAIEATAGYGVIQHGEAVGLGLVAAATAATHMGLCDAQVPDRIAALIKRCGLPARADLAGDDELGAAMRLDKKVQKDRIRFILPTRIGEVVIRDDVPQSAVSAGWGAIRR